MTRREFIIGTGVTCATGVIIFNSSLLFASSPTVHENNTKRLFPPTLPNALKPGMKVGIPAPASGVSKEDFERKVKNFCKALEEIGLVPVLAKSVMAGGSYLAAPDDVRAAEFMEFVTNKDIGAIICIRGGYGTMRILPMLDFAAIQRNPKIICGFSDITALVNVIYQRCNLITFHGPVAAAEFDEFTRQWFLPFVYPSASIKPVNKFTEKNYTDKIHTETVNTPEPLSYTDAKITTIVGGKTTGRIVGGNLTLVTGLMGTPYDIDTAGTILFLEEVGEKAYKVDRMLTQLWLAGKLQECAGVVLGRFSEAEDSTYATTMDEVLSARFASLGIPVISNFPLGHIREKFTMPIGALVELDATARRFTVLEPTVRV
jgi:muramoyltetrapeptide carboxypeptidase